MPSAFVRCTMATDARSCPCPSCGSTLSFAAGTQKLTCEHCGNSFELDVLNSLADSADAAEFSWESYKENFLQDREKLSQSVIYTCETCGGHVEAPATTAAIKCPYCASNLVISSSLSGLLKPNAVIPFKLVSAEVIKRLHDHFKNKILLPSNFKTQHTLSKVNGSYVPFWLFDATMDGPIDFNTTKVRRYSDSNYDYKETKYYLHHLEGDVTFKNVPVDGSKVMPNNLMDAIEPYNYSELKPFDMAYLSGYNAARFDDDPDETLHRAAERMKVSSTAVFRKEVDKKGSFNSITCTKNGLALKKPAVSYALLPVYLINLKYEGKDYPFAINGQTGKLAGSLPISKLRYWLLFLAIFSVLSAIGTFITYYMLELLG